jgi:Tol biopolymer transport system component
LAPGNDTSGYDSRVVFDPVDESKLVYVDASGDLHLLSGISSNGKTNPCNQSSTTGLVDTQLTGPGGLVFSTGQYATGADANPDWSPNGQDLVFDSTRGGGDTLFIIHLTSSPPTGYPIWPSLAAPNETISNEPVFSPSGAELAYVQPRKGSNVYDEDLVSGQNGAWMPNGTATDLTVQDPSGVSFDDEPDWQPIPVPPVLPESPFVPALPILGGLGVGGALLVPFLNRRRRRAALA